MMILMECAIPRHHLKYRGEEHCALLVGAQTPDGYTVRRIVPIPNKHSTPTTKFSVMVEDARFLIGDMVEDVIGVIHSHPHGDTNASAEDLASIDDDYIGAVYCDNRITSWYMRNRPLRSVRVVFPSVEWAAS